MIKNIVLAGLILIPLAACSAESTNTPENVAAPRPTAQVVKVDDTRSFCVSSRDKVAAAMTKLPTNVYEQAGYLLGIGEGLYRSSRGKNLADSVVTALDTLHGAYQDGMDAAEAEDILGVGEALEGVTEGLEGLNLACSAVDA